MTRAQKAVIRNAKVENKASEVKVVDHSEFGGPVCLWIITVIGNKRTVRSYTVGPRGGVKLV